MALKIILDVLLYLSIGFGIAIAIIRFFYPEEDNSGLDDIFDDIAPVVMMFLWPIGLVALVLIEIFCALEALFRRIRKEAREERRAKDDDEESWL